ncbi:MAG: alanine racemase [Flavobacteriaceae bacterium]|nr:alanine racemase [Flavobacteriaceae bacterium]
MPKATETVLEINLTALGTNYWYLKSKLKPNTNFLAVVKAYAYGSDSVEIAKELVKLGADYLAVAYVNEGVALRDAGIKTPIIVLHPQSVNFKTLIDRCLEPNLYSLKIFQEFIEIAKENKQSKYPVHLKFNTGLNRLGFLENDIDFISSKLKETTSIIVKSIFSHLAASEDETEKEFSISQIEAFKNISEKLFRNLDYKPMMHMCNTSGILNYPEAHFDLVRSGIGLYGFSNIPSEQKNFQPIATLKSVISQIHSIEKGETVGYNRAFKSEGILKTATIPIGHADGISRAYGNEKGWVTINGNKASIIGNVCMDMIMVNITNIDCQEGDEVIIFGEVENAEKHAEKINSISYELITAISQRVKRVVCRK